MKIILKRIHFSDTTTMGEVTVNGVFECFSLEDKDRYMEEGTNAKIPGRTAIPRGTYRVTITRSNRFSAIASKKAGKPVDVYLPELHNVPGFSGIRIHVINTHVDTDGCIGVGRTRGNDFIGESRKAMASLQPKIQAALDAGEEVTISVE